MENGQAVRLRHLISGQYLCIRPTVPSDAHVLKNESSINTTPKGQSKSPRNSTISSSKSSPGKSITNNIIPFNANSADNYGNDDEGAENVSEKDRKKYEKDSFLEKIRQNCSVATTSEADKNGIFLIFSCNYNTDVPESDPRPFSRNFITFDESVYFQHEITSCRLQLHENTSLHSDQNAEHSHLNSDSLWGEYQHDIPMQPSDPFESKSKAMISANANACRLEEVDVEEVQDIMFVVRFVPLVSTAIMYVQRPSTQKNVLSSTIYGRLNAALETLSMWATLKYGNESHLLDDDQKIYPNRTRKNSQISIGDNSIISDNSDDEMEVMPCARTRTLTIVERMDRTEYPALVDNGNITSSTISKGIKTNKMGHREKIDSASRASVRRRQGLLSDCRLLEMSLHFAHIIFNLIRDKDVLLDELKYALDDAEDSDDALEIGAFNRIAKNIPSQAQHPPPQILLDCCTKVHELIRSSISLGNQKNAMKIISIHGTQNFLFQILYC